MAGTRVVLVALIVTAAILPMAIPHALAACSIGVTGVNFGAYDPMATNPNDSTGNVSYRCNRRDAVTISLSRGHASTFAPRQMRRGSEVLNYNLYRDATRSSIWGNGTGGTVVYFDPAPPGRNITVTVPIFGRIPPGQDVAVGTYSDDITVTANW
jgi:spore coat protein U-like protein